MPVTARHNAPAGMCRDVTHRRRHQFLCTQIGRVTEIQHETQTFRSRCCRVSVLEPVARARRILVDGHVPAIELGEIHFAMLKITQHTRFPSGKHIHIDKGDPASVNMPTTEGELQGADI